MSLRLYMAGPLFDHKDLIGNALLAASLERIAAGCYSCVLPQDFEVASQRAVDIRNYDLQQLITCDAILCNFDGSELDAGTVVEFMVAKFLDMPAVLLRSDFRAAGDQDKDADPWNLMCSFYPRTHVAQCNALAWYQEARRAGGTLTDSIERFYQRLATFVMTHVEAVCHEPSLPKDQKDDLERLYQWVLTFPGSGFADLCSDPSFIARVVAARRARGLA